MCLGPLKRLEVEWFPKVGERMREGASAVVQKVHVMCPGNGTERACWYLFSNRSFQTIVLRKLLPTAGFMWVLWGSGLINIRKFRGGEPTVQNGLEESRSTIHCYFQSFSAPFWIVRTPDRRGPMNSSLNFSTFGPKGPYDSCSRQKLSELDWLKNIL